MSAFQSILIGYLGRKKPRVDINIPNSHSLVMRKGNIRSILLGLKDRTHAKQQIHLMFSDRCIRLHKNIFPCEIIKSFVAQVRYNSFPSNSRLSKSKTSPGLSLNFIESSLKNRRTESSRTRDSIFRYDTADAPLWSILH